MTEVTLGEKETLRELTTAQGLVFLQMPRSTFVARLWWPKKHPKYKSARWAAIRRRERAALGRLSRQLALIEIKATLDELVHDGEVERVGDAYRSSVSPSPHKWTRGGIIAAIHRWNDTYGEPPALTDWNPYQARRVFHDDARARRFEEGPWPWFTNVVRRFGSWSNAMSAAGFTPRPPNGGGGNWTRSQQQRAKRQRPTPAVAPLRGEGPNRKQPS